MKIRIIMNWSLYIRLCNIYIQVYNFVLKTIDAFNTNPFLMALRACFSMTPVDEFLFANYAKFVPVMISAIRLKF